jgi:predicted Zn-ribbon and HTH transcriptional regulator
MSFTSNRLQHSHCPKCESRMINRPAVELSNLFSLVT